MLKLYLKLGIEIPTGDQPFLFSTLYNISSNFFEILLGTSSLWAISLFILILTTGPVTNSTIHHDTDPH